MTVASFESRRNALKTMTGTAGLALTGTWIGAAFGQVPQPMASPNAPTNQNAPAGLDLPESVKQGKAPPNTMNQEQIVVSVQQLYKLASDLKEEVEHTNLKTTLPLDFVKKAQQIEKLAKQIKEHAKG
jgi:hypothetical protein